jgi:hypothetical protein
MNVASTHRLCETTLQGMDMPNNQYKRCPLNCQGSKIVLKDPKGNICDFITWGFGESA